MQVDQETLQQALLEVEHLRQREAQSRQNAESLLVGLERLSSAHSQKDSVLAILSVLTSIIDLDEAVVLCEIEPDKVVSLAETDARFRVVCGKPAPTLARALTGKPIVLSNAAISNWWDNLKASGFADFESVVMVPVSPVEYPTIIVCLKREPAVYAKSDNDKLKFFIPLAAHAIRHSFNLAELRKAVVELDEARSAAEASARTDPLTRLANRMHLEEHMAHILSTQRNCCFALIDLNGFKPINDNFGHYAGDVVLVQIARRLSNSFADDVFVARIGGDEFALVTTDAMTDEALAKLGEAICKLFQSPVTFETREFEIGASVGIACKGKIGESAKDLLLAADAAMYEVKAQRKTGYAVAPRAECMQNKTIVDAIALATAIEKDQIEPFYQPQFDLKSGDMVGLELLARWKHPAQGIVLPNAFITEIERSGLSERFTAKMMRKALTQSRIWLNDGFLVPDISFNLFDANLTSLSAMDGLLDIVSLYPEMQGKVVFEIKQSVFFGRSSSQVNETLKEIRKSGARISLDDFGTGFASLTGSAQFEFHELKIDRTFIAGIGKGYEKEAIIKAIVMIAEAHCARVVAEGVEEAHQYEFLRQTNCHLAQGFLLGRPTDAAGIREILCERMDANGRIAI